MATPLEKPAANAAEAPDRRTFLPRESAGVPFHDSPARVLQRELARAMAGAAAAYREPRWSKRRTAVALLFANGLAWISLIRLLRGM